MVWSSPGEAFVRDRRTSRSLNLIGMETEMETYRA